jgi:hypothetical protein
MSVITSTANDRILFLLLPKSNENEEAGFPLLSNGSHFDILVGEKVDERIL